MVERWNFHFSPKASSPEGAGGPVGYGAGEEEDIVEVDEHEPVQHVTENIVNWAWNTAEALVRPNGQTNNQIFLVSFGHVEGCLLLVPFPYPHQMVGVPPWRKWWPPGAARRLRR
jgi:hypothetical protein